MRRLARNSMTASSIASRKLFAVMESWDSIVDFLSFSTDPFPSLPSGKCSSFPRHLPLPELFLFNCRFGAFEELKKRSVDSKGNLSASQRLLCGLGAGVAEAIFAVTPMETVKVKFINDQRSANPQFKGFYHGVRTIIKNEGLLMLPFMSTLTFCWSIIPLPRNPRNLPRVNSYDHETRI